MVKVAFSFKSQGLENSELFSQATENCQNLSYEGLITVDLKYIGNFQSCCIEIVTKRNRYFLTSNLN